jgi:hypothetical protein
MNKAQILLEELHPLPKTVISTVLKRIDKTIEALSWMSTRPISDMEGVLPSNLVDSIVKDLNRIKTHINKYKVS